MSTMRTTRDEHFKYARPRDLRSGERRGVCSKICYESRKSAKRALHRMTRSADYVESDRPFHEYHCSLCDAYHLGHGPLRRAG